AIYPFNFINGEGVMVTKSNFVYLEGTQNIYIYTNLSLEQLKSYRYRMLVNDTVEKIHWKAPYPQSKFNYFAPVKFLKKLPSRKNLPHGFKLASLECMNKKITFQIYNIHKPNKLSTIYLYN